MRGVVIAAEGAARHDDADRRFRAHHRPDLHRRGMGAQHLAAAIGGARRQIERIVLLPRGMLRRDVERGEVMEIVLDMRPFGNGEAHLAEDRDQLVDRLADRMDAAVVLGLHRQGDVDAFLRQPPIERRALVLLLGFAERGLDHALELVERGAARLALVGSERAERLEQAGELAVATENRRHATAPARRHSKPPRSGAASPHEPCRDFPPRPSGLRERRLCLGHDRLKRRVVARREIGEHFAVELDARQLQAVDELRIGQPGFARAGIDALNPQRAKIALLVAPVAIGVLQPLLDLFDGDAETLCARPR